MALSTNSASSNRNGQPHSDTSVGKSVNGASQHLLHLNEVAGILRVGPEEVIELSNANIGQLSHKENGNDNDNSVFFTHSDLAVLIHAQQTKDQQVASVSSDTATAQARLSPESTEPESSAQEKKPIPLREHMNRARDPEKDESGTQEEPSVDYQSYVPSRFDEYRPLREEVAESSRIAQEQPTTQEVASPLPSEPPQERTGEIEPNSVQSGSELAQPLSRDQMLGEMLSTVANSQQSVLNVQDSIREMLNVIAQDNFNLKHENRKLRERMLELERIISEHQRREETRKEMLESRMRAVEGTLSALQQQLAQLVQLQRQRIRKHWFK